MVMVIGQSSPTNQIFNIQYKKCISNSKAAAVSVVSFSYHLCRWQELIESPASTRNALLLLYTNFTYKDISQGLHSKFKNSNSVCWWFIQFFGDRNMQNQHEPEMDLQVIYQYCCETAFTCKVFSTRIAQQINYNKRLVVAVVRSGLYNLFILMFERSAQQFIYTS